MNKEFTVSIPDELYSLDNTLNKTMVLQYSGPDVLNVIVTNRVPSTVLEEANEFSTELNAATDTAAAYLLHTAPITTEYILVEETLDNGEVYKNISNPNLHDYYTVIYEEVSGWSLKPIIRDSKTPGLLKANYLISRINDMIARTKLTDNPLELSAEILTALNDYLDTLTEYSVLEEPKKAWKYITYSSTPAVPEVLQELLGE